MKILLTLLVLVLQCYCPVSAQTSLDDYDVDTMIQGARYYDDFVKSFNGDIDITVEIQENPNEHSKNILTKYLDTEYPDEGLVKELLIFKLNAKVFSDGTRIGYEYKRIWQNANDVKTEVKFRQVYDGESWEALRLSRELPDGVYTPMGHVGDLDLYDEFNPLFIVDSTTIMKFGDFLSQYAFSGELKIIEYNSTDEVIQIQIKTEQKQYDIWISVNTMFRPLKMKVFEDNSIRSIQYTYKKYDNQIWFPETKTIKHTDGNNVLVYNTTLLISNGYTLNEKLSDNMFKINFPEYTKIHNTITKQTYIYDPNYEE